MKIKDFHQYPKGHKRQKILKRFLVIPFQYFKGYKQMEVLK
jgi:hypothetical protein